MLLFCALLSTLCACKQDSQEAAAVAAAAASPAAAAAGRPPSAKKRRNSQAPTQHVPASASLTDLANLAAAVAEESFDDPVLGDQEQQQDQGMMLAAYASGSLGGALSVQPETGATGGRGARGGSRARQRTPAPSSSGADEGDSLGMSFPLVNEDGKPLVSGVIAAGRLFAHAFLLLWGAQHVACSPFEHACSRRRC